MVSSEEKLTCAYDSEASAPRNWHEIMSGDARFLSDWTRKKKVSSSTKLGLDTGDDVNTVTKKGYSGP